MASETRRGLLLIGALKLLKSGASLAAGAGLLSLQRDAEPMVRHWIEFLRLDTHARLVDQLLAKVAGLDQHTLRRLGVGALLYATVFGVEGVGLLLRKPWAEYLTTAVTTSFLPIEGYEMITHPSWMKALVILINVAVVVYLLLEIRQRRREHASQRPAPEAIAAQSRS